MKRVGIFVVAVCLGLAAGASAQDKAVLETFDHYEQVRVALSIDTLLDVAMHAKMLAPVVEKIAGPRAKAAVAQLITVKSLDDASKHFGELSALLVPKFQAAKIPGTQAYMCAMKQKPWDAAGRHDRQSVFRQGHDQMRFANGGKG